MARTSRIAGGISVALLLFGILASSNEPQSVGSSVRRVRSWRSNAFFRRPADDRTNPLPSVIFWAWERPEDLRFLDPRRTGVAFLAKTVYILPPDNQSSQDSGARLVVRPRLQPLRVAPSTALVAVVRIETPIAPFPDTNLRAVIAHEIAALQNLPGVRAVQIDFDARLSERAFYSALLLDVRRQLPPSMPLSITALASWCLGDPWLGRLPPGTIDEAVPMLFRMGPEDSHISRFLRMGDDFRVAACRGSLGLSTDEPLSSDLLRNTVVPDSEASRKKRIYVFDPHPWTRAASDSVLQELKPWHIE